MKYKVGDKVKVRSDLEVGKRYGNSDVYSQFMRELSGKKVTIGKVFSDHYYLEEDTHPLRYSWTDDMFEGLEDGKMYASELMELARKEPEKYEGKRYKVLGLCCIGPESQFYGEVIVDSEGKLQGKGYDNWAYINSNTELEEIPPEPKPVPFMEAVKANGNNKTVECKIHGYVNVYKPTLASGMIDQNGRAVSTCEIVHGEWFIKEG